MNQSYTKSEREWIGLVKQCSCVICDKPPISEAHHTKQKNPFTTVSLCKECHRNIPIMKRIHKFDDNDLISITVGRVYKLLKG